MNRPENQRASHLTTIAFLGRFLLAAVFLYTGVVKATHPVEFLKLLREYQISPSLLNIIAATLPWFEIFVAMLLFAGVAVRGAALIAAGMLLPFTLAVLQRAVALHQAEGTPFCWIRFDCGCGTGEVLICRKLVENAALTLLALLIAFRRSPRLAFRYDLIKRRAPASPEPAA
jgi:uncharacterized membrane protein YphA (DoxX/SURF4 family)